MPRNLRVYKTVSYWRGKPKFCLIDGFLNLAAR